MILLLSLPFCDMKILGYCSYKMMNTYSDSHGNNVSLLVPCLGAFILDTYSRPSLYHGSLFVVSVCRRFELVDALK